MEWIFKLINEVKSEIDNMDSIMPRIPTATRYVEKSIFCQCQIAFLNSQHSTGVGNVMEFHHTTKISNVVSVFSIDCQ
jgi:hypothetical protein